MFKMHINNEKHFKDMVGLALTFLWLSLNHAVK